eukprot:1600679-Alexandrium_andersonii.AAC.1
MEPPAAAAPGGGAPPAHPARSSGGARSTDNEGADDVATLGPSPGHSGNGWLEGGGPSAPLETSG